MGVVRLDWAKLLSDKRLPKEPPGGRSIGAAWLVNSRLETERDFDRVLFAAPTRRLGDKTQVFPLEKNESVRTRLTHSHEVSNLARSIGTHLANSELGERIIAEAEAGLGKDCGARVRRSIPAILAATGLAHDLGNPPFGHQGERAIRNWINLNEREIFEISPEQARKLGDAGRNNVQADLDQLTYAHKEDFRKFEGNAQTLRTLTRLQVVKDNRGLNLTFGTLAALMKYTVDSASIEDKNGPVYARKVGHYASEALLVSRIRTETGLNHGPMRHPLTYIMEACDDIAYLIVDAEDAVKKQIVSFHDLIAWLSNGNDLQQDELTSWVLSVAQSSTSEIRAARLSPAEINDVSMQLFRTNAITALVSAAIRAFETHYESIMKGELDRPLLEISSAKRFAEEMKKFDMEHAYKHRRVLEIELDGFNTLQALLDMLWRGITERERFDNPASPRTTPFARYAYGRISENYRRVFEGRLESPDQPRLPIRYRELQLLMDMVAGMTDQFAVDLEQELKGFHVGASAPRN